MIAADWPRGTVIRQLMLGGTLDTENVRATYNRCLSLLRILVAERAKPSKTTIEHGETAHEVDAKRDQNLVGA